MRVLIQRVRYASCKVDGAYTGKIDQGLLMFVGCRESDDDAVIAKMADKASGLRIFEDENGKTNLSLKDVNGELLFVSQFTLYANCKKGNRPSFIEAGDPDTANELYEYIIREAAKSVPIVQHGIFGADMKVHLINDGPFTIILDKHIL